jgi:hypothetical protein
MHVRYVDRIGGIAHYPSTNPFQLPEVRPNERFFVTIDILAQPSIYNVYQNTRALVSLEPMAVFAEVRRLDDEAWRDYKVEMRLTAFRMATAQHAMAFSYDQEKFMETVSQSFHDLGYDQCTSGSEKLTWLEQWLTSEITKPLYFADSDELRSQTCDVFTYSPGGREMK